MFRTASSCRNGGYWSLPLVDDWDMMLRMGEVARLANLDEVLHYYRVHAGSLNGSGMRRMRLQHRLRLRTGPAPARRTAARITFERVSSTQRDREPWWRRALGTT